MNDLFAVYKPKGISSFAVITKIRKILKIKKVGHGGTLDPLASGVLVIGVGRTATKKLFSDILVKEKEYLAKLVLGQTSSTDDEEGEKNKISNYQPKLAEIEKALDSFIGQIKQIPPKFSAIKIKGRRAYEMARLGESVKLKPRIVLVKKIELLNYQYPFVEIKVLTGPGCYIRSLVRDLGDKLGVGAYLLELERIRDGNFTISDCFDLEKLCLKKN